MLSLAVIALIAAQDPGALPLPAEALAKKITLKMPATRAAVALPEIGKQLGVTMETINTTANEVLILDVTEASAKDVLTRIADVTSGTWMASEAGIVRLVPDTARRQREEREWIHKNQARVQKDLQEMAQLLEKQRLSSPDDAMKILNPPKAPSAKPGQGKPGEVAEAIMPPGMGGMPVDAASRAARRAAIAVGAATIASMKEGDRVVFATTPNRMQRALPNGGAILNTMVREHDLLLKAFAAMPKKNNEDEMEAFIEPMASPPVKMLFVLEKESFGSTHGSMRIYDKDGNVLTESSVYFTNRDRMDVEAEMGEEEVTPGAKPKAPDTDFPLSEESAELVKFFNSMGMGMFTGGAMPEAGPKNPKFEAALDQPAVFDPLRFLVTDCAFALASKSKANLIGNLPDYSIGIFSAFTGSKVGLERAKQAMTTEGKVKLDEKDGWMVLSPAEPHESRSLRADRLALHRLMQTTKSKLLPSLDDMASYALSSPPPSEGDAAILYVLFRMPGMVAQMMGGDGWSLLRFFGTLSPIQRQTLGQGKSIPFTALSPRQLELVNKLTFGAAAQLSVEGDDEPPTDPDSPFEDMFGDIMGGARFGGVARSSFLGEPTEVLPNGLVGAGSLKVDVKTSIAAMQDGGRSFMTMMAGSLTAPQIGAMQAMTEMAAAAGEGQGAEMGFFGEMMKFDSLRLGEKATYKFTFQVAPKVTVGGRLVDQRFDRNTKPVPLNQLPADFLKLVSEAKAKAKKQFEDMGGAGGFEPPPARR